MVQQEFLDTYNIVVDNECIIDLDSSTPIKFSRHLIFRVPGSAFTSNIHCGNFAKNVVQRVSEKKMTDFSYQQLFKWNDKGKLMFLADMSVYTRNRNFRLYKSSKYGKNVFLLPSSITRYQYIDDHDLFMSSLVCNVEKPPFVR